MRRYDNCRFFTGASCTACEKINCIADGVCKYYYPRSEEDYENFKKEREERERKYSS
jgi:hypothetical protein